MKDVVTLYAFVATEKDGTEGIPSMTIGNQHFMMATMDEKILANMRRAAVKLAGISGVSIRLVKFTDGEIIEHFQPAEKV
jgi:hypothetical protein